LILAESDFNALYEPLRRCIEIGCKLLCQADGEMYIFLNASDYPLRKHLMKVFSQGQFEYEIRAAVPLTAGAAVFVPDKL